MGVPITFLDKYNPEQFEILGITDRDNNAGLKTREYSKRTRLIESVLRKGVPPSTTW